ncbi:uncharacterized protein EKO05_0003195 [Ascochyta rabiei]|uniref:uncharacterized protein n=1 Tax=Didymella rabiei TaxID=5454 RepID=UPI0021F96FE3|nr:uncharacterized protein EKO05_0003195 [Ascochyta rabiei]UPX12654.1 hypothetical protein EKO05_0003195 [Ascochyta rabiei]
MILAGGIHQGLVPERNPWAVPAAYGGLAYAPRPSGSLVTLGVFGHTLENLTVNLLDHIPDAYIGITLKDVLNHDLIRMVAVLFVCYVLRIIADEEARAAQRSGGEASDDSDEQGHDDDKEAEEEEEDEEEESDRGSDMNSTARSSRSARSARSGESEDDAGSNNSSSRRPQRRKKKTDYMMDARELFCWQGSQRLRAMQLWAALEGGD